MTVQTDILPEHGDATVPPRLLRVHDTQWGFIVYEASTRPEDMLAETGFKFMAFAALFAAGAQWLLPGSLFSGDVLIMKLGLTSVLTAAGIWFLRASTRAETPELQVDAARREIRIATRNAHGTSRIRSRIAMRDIEECFVRPGRPEDRRELCFRVTGQQAPVRIAAGGAGDLAPVLARLTRDLRTPRERVALRMAG